MDMEAGWKSAKPRKKTQTEKRNEKKMRNSYFTQQYEAFGENFINFKTAQDIKKDSFKIFKALADAAIDLETCISPAYLHHAFRQTLCHYSTMSA